MSDDPSGYIDYDYIAEYVADMDERFRRVWEGADQHERIYLKRGIRAGRIYAGGEGKGQARDDEYRILEMFFDARRHYHDLYGYDEEEAADGFVDWVDEVLGDYLDGRYEGSPHNPESVTTEETPDAVG